MAQKMRRNLKERERENLFFLLLTFVVIVPYIHEVRDTTKVNVF